MTAAKGKRPAGAGAKKESVDLLFKELIALLEPLEADEQEGEIEFDIAGAIKLIDRILALEPDNRNALNYKGMMLLGQGEHKKADSCFSAILKKNPADKEALNNKAIALYGQGKSKEALKYVDKAIELDRRYADALMNKAVILHDLGQLAEAHKFLVRARALGNIQG